MADSVVVPILADSDIVVARQEGRRVAQAAGIVGSDLTLVATAISELARNIVDYANRGEVRLEVVARGTRRGVSVCALDRGPGIPDLGLAMQDGWSSSRSLGIGLPGARRLMDEFSIASVVGQGTTVTAIKWAR